MMNFKAIAVISALCCVNALVSFVTLNALMIMTGLIVQGASRLKTITRDNSRSDCDVIRSGLIVIISS